MAIGTPTLIDKQTNDASATTIVLTVPVGGVAAGVHVLVGACCWDPIDRSATVADSKTNTWQVDLDVYNNGTGSLGHNVFIASAKITNALVSGDTITITYSASVGYRKAAGYQVSGLNTTTWKDQTGSSANASSTSMTSGVTSTRTQASELLYGVFEVDINTTTATFTAGTGFTALDTVGGGVINSEMFCTEYQIVSSTGTDAATGTLSNAHANTGLIATYIGAAAAAATGYQNIPILGAG